MQVRLDGDISKKSKIHERNARLEAPCQDVAHVKKGLQVRSGHWQGSTVNVDMSTRRERGQDATRTGRSWPYTTIVTKKLLGTKGIATRNKNSVWVLESLFNIVYLGDLNIHLV